MIDLAGQEHIRAFIAIPTGPELRKAIASLQQELGHSVPDRAVRWISHEQIHLTLKFLGEIPVSLLADIRTALTLVCGACPSLQLTAGSLGCFPHERDPRVLWVGFRGDLSPLKTLVQQMEKQLTPWFPPEVREFHPHLTIGRIKFATPAVRRAIRAVMQAHARDSFGSWEADQVELFRSELINNGARHTLLQTWPLGT
jgi:2'-5' RNA ligase